MTRNDLDANIQSLESEGNTVVCLAINQTPRLVLSLEENYPAKNEARKVIRYLSQVLGIKIAMLTGDNMSSAHKVANFLKIPHEYIFSKASPG